MSQSMRDNVQLPPSVPGLELQEQIGQGGMGVVYRALHVHLGRSVALKVQTAPLRDEATLAAWQRECRILASLEHPHVVTIHDAGQSQGRCYLVMEHLPGGSLRSRMTPGKPWRVADAARVLEQIASALTHLHERGVLHLDLKPENVLCAADGQIKIADFGLAAPPATSLSEGPSEHRPGTADYCAPEQRFGLPCDARCDVFSLATLAYELLTGRLPGRVYVPASQYNGLLTPQIDAILQRGLAREPEDRDPSVQAFAQSLLAACREEQRPRRMRRFTGAALLAGACALLLFVANQSPWASDTPAIDRPPALEFPSDVWLLYRQPEELSLLAGESGDALSVTPQTRVHRWQVDDPQRQVPSELGLPLWPSRLPAIWMASANARGFVFPLFDRTLGERVISNWAKLLPPISAGDHNFVQAGNFEGDCLTYGHRGPLWRYGGGKNDQTGRQISLERSPTLPGHREVSENTALLLDNLDADANAPLLGCYQPLADAPRSGVLVLRYRARSRHARASLVVYASLPIQAPDEYDEPAATRIRGACISAPAEDPDASPTLLYRVPLWVTPSTAWQTYEIVFEAPALAMDSLHRNLVIDIKGADQVWIDDVELFAWQPQ